MIAAGDACASRRAELYPDELGAPGATARRFHRAFFGLGLPGLAQNHAARSAAFSVPKCWR